MTTTYADRPFNVRYPVRIRTGTYTPERLQTHRTAKASWLYMHRLHGVDDFGPMPDWSKRNDLVAAGRCAPQRASDPSFDGIALWAQADAHAARFRPDEPVCAHAVGSLPLNEDLPRWRDLIEGFAEDHLVAQGMVVDWVIHQRAETAELPEILPHVHMLITTRAYDTSLAECGRIRQTWIRTEKARKALAEKWWARTGIYPRSYALAA